MNIHTRNRFFYVIIGAAIFSLIGFWLPDFYFRYLDNTQYYSLVQPIPVDKKFYKPCEDTTLTTTRTSLVDTQANFSIDLILRDSKNNAIVKINNAHFSRDASIKVGTITVSVIYKLPCELKDGLYFWQATIRYSVRGYEKQYTYVSDTFNVNKYGVDPQIINIDNSIKKKLH